MPLAKPSAVFYVNGMHNNTNAELLRRFYDCFGQSDVDGMLAVCSDDVTFQLQGRGRLAGKYTKETVGAGLIQKMAELSSGTFKTEVHDIMASDRHGMVLTTNRLTKGGKPFEYRAVHVWRIQDGKLVAWYEYFRDQYQYDSIWD